MWWFAQLDERWRVRLAWLIAFSVLGAVLEVLQGMTPNRQAEALDWVADSLGLGLGWGLAAVLPSPPLGLRRR